MKSIYSPSYRALLAWLRTHRISSKLSMREVGLRMGISHSWVEKVETGERRLGVTEYVRLCDVIHAEPERGIAIIKAAITPYKEAVPVGLKAADPSPSYRIPRKPKREG